MMTKIVYVDHSRNTNNSSSYSGLPNHITEERQDVIFRKVRGILNKITPETFDKLSKELVNVGLDSPRTLRGVIYLLFDKALKDLKYSSLYAKLCQELSEKAPNFEQESGPNTFCKFLISKCEDEFERRRKATEDFDRKNELTDEEYELRAIAKQKMLGNIKFICELGKKRLLQEEILHECIRGLLSKKKERPIQDQAQDLECLCQIMRTIGSLLDIQASRNLMNQYFERIDMFSRKSELPPRIKFMLRDVIDLRNNNWRPRPFQREDNVPTTLSRLREEAGFDPTAGSSIDKFGNSRSLIGISDLSKLRGDKLSMLLDDEPSFTTSTDFHWGPAFLPIDQSFDAFSASSTGVRRNPSNPISNNTTNAHPPTMGLPFQRSPPFQQIDPLTDFRRSDRQANTNSSPAVKLGSENTRLVEGSAFEKRHFSDTSIVNARNDRESSASNPRNNNKALNMSNHPPRMQQREEHQPRRYVESRQPQGIRGGNISPTTRTNIRRHPHDMNQVQFPPQSHAPSLQNHRYDRVNMHGDGPENRDRRGNRPDLPDHTQNQPRFSNNYRQARNDRPPNNRNHYFEKSNHPESELNFNWRAGPSPSVAALTNNAATSPPVNTTPRPAASRSNEQFVESRVGGVKLGRPVSSSHVAVMNKHSEATKKPDEPPSNENRPLAEKNNLTVKNDRDTPPTINFRSGPPAIKAIHPGIQHRNDQPTNSIRYIDVRLGQVVRNPTAPPSNPMPLRRPANEISQPQVQPIINQHPRNNSRGPHNEILDRRDHRKFNLPFAHDQEHQHKHDDNGVFSPERNVKPARSQQFGNSSATESDRISNWRRETHNTSSNATRDQPTQNQNPLLPKPPTRISETNFSLRPSHNLVGRTIGVLATNQIPRNSNANSIQNDSAQSKSIGDANGNVANNSNPVNKFQPEGAQAPLQSSTLPAVKVLSDVNGESDSKSRSTNESPTRTAARDFHVNKFISVLSECFDENSPNVNRAAAKVKELKIPKNYQHECLVSAMKQSILKTENDRDNICKFFVQLVPSTFESPSLLNAFRVIFEQMHALEVETPKVKSLVAGFLSQAILDGLLLLEEVGNVLSGGKHHPLFLLCLQKLEKSAGQAWLNEKFIASKINLIDMLPEVERSKERLASVLKDRCLGFLDPMLTVEPDLWTQMKERDPSPAAVYRWIKENIDQTLQSNPAFTHVLISCLLKYIHNVAQEKSKVVTLEQNDDGDANGSQSNKSSPSTASLSSSDLEKELLTKYQQVLQAMLKNRDLQLATLYTLQSFYHGLDFPKGSLLRWFHMLYEMNIVDDDVFFVWKEEINDEFPGKGQALFQVNTWLNWLAEADSDEEEEEEV